MSHQQFFFQNNPKIIFLIKVKKSKMDFSVCGSIPQESWDKVFQHPRKYLKHFLNKIPKKTCNHSSKIVQTIFLKMGKNKSRYKIKINRPRSAQDNNNRVCRYKDFVSILCHMEIRQKTIIITKRYHKAKWVSWRC